MNQRENKGKPKPSRSKELSDKDHLEHLAECIVYATKKELPTDLEAFENYACHLRMRFHRRGKQFKEKIVNGYEILLHTLHTMDLTK